MPTILTRSLTLRLKHVFAPKEKEHKPKKEKTPKVEKTEAEATKVGLPALSLSLPSSRFQVLSLTCLILCIVQTEETPAAAATAVEGEAPVIEAVKAEETTTAPAAAAESEVPVPGLVLQHHTAADDVSPIQDRGIRPY